MVTRTADDILKNRDFRNTTKTKEILIIAAIIPPLEFARMIIKTLIAKKIISKNFFHLKLNFCMKNIEVTSDNERKKIIRPVYPTLLYNSESLINRTLIK